MTFQLSPQRHPNVIGASRETPSHDNQSFIGYSWRSTLDGVRQHGRRSTGSVAITFLLNRALFGMTLQAAVEAPKFSSEHFPASFGSADRFANRLRIEAVLGRSLLEELSSRGRDMKLPRGWRPEGFLLAIERHADDAVLEAACDPRCAKSQIFAPGVRVS